MNIAELAQINGKPCPCGREHRVDCLISCGGGVLAQLPRTVRQFGGQRVFVLCDRTTYRAAGEKVCALLTDAGLAVSCHILAEERPEPNENSVGSAVMHFDHRADVIVGVGSGVINDIGKILSATAGKPYIIVATAPSMDGYASATSSMTRDGLKVSIPSKTPDAVIGDTDILRNAPMHMLKSGLGDMLAKFVSICEWRIGALVTGEYYCEALAELVRRSLKKCLDNSAGLLRREAAAVEAVFSGLAVCGIAMTYAGVSRPASGAEHYLSHIWDMRGNEFGDAVDLHGIQCAIATRMVVGLYHRLAQLKPDREKALAHARSFDYENWSEAMRAYLGRSAESMIALEAREGKYAPAAHAERLERILAHWADILAVIDEELPTDAELDALFAAIEMPRKPGDVGMDDTSLAMAFKTSKDIRFKYVLGHLCWDLGILCEMAEML